jgi:HEAT repeat protein
MAPSRSPFERKLTAIADLERQPASKENVVALTRWLQDKNALLVSRAARATAALGLEDLEPTLVTAFHHFMQDLPRRDKGCVAKIAIVRALVEMALRTEETFLQGLRHIQMEPAYDGAVDTATELRALSAHGLVNCQSTNAVSEIVRLLTDTEIPVRIAAAKALGDSGREEAVPALRLMVLQGDSEIEVLMQSMISLLHLAPEPSILFVGEFLNSRDAETFEAAALALGESRREDAVSLLLERWPELDPDRRRALLLALSSARRSDSLKHLFGLLRHAHPDLVREALAALRIHLHDPAMVDRVRDALGARETLEGIGGSKQEWLD